MEGASRTSQTLAVQRSPDGTVTVGGEVTTLNAAEFAFQLRDLEVERALTLDLSRLDLDDEIALAIAVDSLRELRARVSRLVLKGAPQILGHNLYRIGALAGSHAIELVDMRLDEPSSS